MRNNGKYLDLGVCFGQDLRQLVMDGAPSENTYGVDIEKDLVELGFDLFRDRQSLKTEFIIADVFDPKKDWSKLEGTIDVFHASAVFHLFTRDKQIHIGQLLVRLGRQRPGTLIVGRQVGRQVPGERPMQLGQERVYQHNVESLRLMWKEIGAMTGTSWSVEGSLDSVGMSTSLPPPTKSNGEPGSEGERLQRLLFTVRRLA